MEPKPVLFKGIGKPLSEEELQKLIEEIKCSDEQTREDSKVDLRILNFEFNY